MVAARRPLSEQRGHEAPAQVEVPHLDRQVLEDLVDRLGREDAAPLRPKLLGEVVGHDDDAAHGALDLPRHELGVEEAGHAGSERHPRAVPLLDARGVGLGDRPLDATVEQ